MTVSFDHFATALLLSPFAAALLAPVLAKHGGRAAGWALALVPAALFLALLTTLGDVAAGHPVRIAIDWVPALDLRLSFLIDGLGLVFALAVTGIGAFIVIYSATYLHDHPHRGRFLAFMLLFMGAMLGLVLTDRLVGLFVLWELTSVTSFLLIGFDHEREAARRGAIQAIIVTASGGLSLMAGGVLLHHIAGTWTISELAASPTLREGGAYYPWVLGFIAVAAFTKSAQWPFHFWLPNAMEAPTPVSAYLHSATMVQAGVYLLARTSPLLGGTPQWQALLCAVGALTLLWGGVVSLRQVDLKQILAHTTIASLGLLVLLLGIGGEAAAMGVASYFVAHALYKAGLFLVTGIIDHGTGTRDITVLGGLRDSLTITFICAALAGLSMFGIPPLTGYIAKEEMYAALTHGDVQGMVTIAAMVVGNALLGAVGLAIMIRPFMGALKPTPLAPHEGDFSLWIGPALLGLAGLAVMFAVSSYGALLLAPMAASIVGEPVESHLGYAVDFAALPVWLSVATWLLAIVIYLRLDWIRGTLGAIIPSRRGVVTSRGRRAVKAAASPIAPEVEEELDRSIAERAVWTWDRGFDQVMFGIIRFAGGWTRTFHNGRLEIYVVIAFACLALMLVTPLWAMSDWPAFPVIGKTMFYEWGAVAMAAIGVLMVLAARTRLGAIIALGVQGLAVALIFMLFGAPDLAFTQLMVETLSVVILALVMTRLRLSAQDPRPFEDLARDGVLALLIGAATSVLLLRVLQGVFDGRLSEFFAKTSVEIAHGHNIVNVILVDYRGLDTLGEISVVMTAGIAALALLRRQHKHPALAPEPRRAARRRR